MNARGVDTFKHLTDAAAAYAGGGAKDQDELEAFMREVEELKLRFLYRSGNGSARRIDVKGAPAVFIAMPHTGHIEPETSLAAYAFATDMKMTATIVPQGSSLLAFGFNKLWCLAATDERKYDYWSMLHSDAGPSRHWLDVMAEEMARGGFDVLHAVMAIKDTLGLTSTAVGTRNPELWTRRRRLTLTEIHQLPETFSYEDVVAELGEDFGDGCLLNNTGVMLVKVGPWCDRFSGFEIRDRIVRYFPDNGESLAMNQEYDRGRKWVPRAEVIPEDWNLGAWCARNGLKVGGTRRVTTHHFGRASFPNDSPWGEWKRDEHFFTAREHGRPQQDR